jgi:hypothetical protein
MEKLYQTLNHFGMNGRGAESRSGVTTPEEGLRSHTNRLFVALEFILTNGIIRLPLTVITLLSISCLPYRISGLV